MPELPEVQALAERIDAALRGAQLVRAEPLSFAGLKSVLPSPGELAGQVLWSAGRRGKFLVLELERHRLLVHLSQGGRVVFEQGWGPARPKGGVVRFVFDRPPALLVREFGTERKAGWWVLGPGDEGPLARLGPEPFSEAFEALVLAGSDPGRLHPLLRDQRRVAGIGRGYADDILHRAGLSPFRSLRSLAPAERRRLLAAVRDVLSEALQAERRREGGLPPKLGDHFAVHGRWGTPCPRCGEELRRVSYESHEVTYCPRCQTGGRVLADRRLSRLLR
ncbi:MAG TPA: DNA-formamidopyrimidine glycosylase family protein [Actinomycetota bacterium]|nr:DNA-formamidopyrimidine glycosylase family protein [Actinomycetota bacterium]